MLSSNLTNVVAFRPRAKSSQLTGLHTAAAGQPPDPRGPRRPESIGASFLRSPPPGGPCRHPRVARSFCPIFHAIPCRSCAPLTRQKRPSQSHAQSIRSANSISFCSYIVHQPIVFCRAPRSRNDIAAAAPTCISQSCEFMLPAASSVCCWFFTIR